MLTHRRNQLLVLASALAIVFGVQRYLLHNPISLVSLDELLVVLIFLGVVFYIAATNIKSISNQDILWLFVVTWLLGVSVIVSIPQAKTLSEARAFTSVRQEAQELGQQLADKYLDGELSATETSRVLGKTKRTTPSNQTDQREQQEIKQIVIDSFNEAINPNSNYEVVPTVPVKYDEWTCNEYGCSYAATNVVWTINQSDRILGAAISSFSMLTLVWLLFSGIKHKDA